MPLSKQEIDALMRLVGLTEEREINCEECLQAVAQFAEHELEGKSISDSLYAVEQHLAVCTECREEYDALRRTLDDYEHEAGS